MNTLKHLLIGLAIVVLPLGMTLPSRAATADLDDKLGDVGETAGFGNEELTDTIGGLINVFLGLLGIIFLLLVIYAGFLWMTAGGDDKKVGTAKNILISAVVGLVVLLSAYAISNFVIEQLTEATGTGA